MKYYFNKSALGYAFVCSLCVMLFLGCTKAKKFSAEYDITWPVPVITSFTPVKDTVGKTITITGSHFEKISKVTIGIPETQADIISSTPTSIVVKIPRTVTAGPITIYTNYKQTVASRAVFTPVYLDVTITNWPTRIIRGQAFVIGGKKWIWFLKWK